MRFLVCATEANPCPVSDQAWTSVVDLIDPTLLGVTPVAIAKVMAWGFGFVFGCWLLGIGLGWTLRVVRSL